MKKFNYYYWFAYPCLSEPVVEQIGERKSINEQFTAEQVNELNQLYFQRKNSEEQQFFIVVLKADGSLEYSKLSEKITANNKDDNFAKDDIENVYFCYSDPCAAPNIAGWTARLYITMLVHLWYQKFKLEYYLNGKPIAENNVSILCNFYLQSAAQR